MPILSVYGNVGVTGGLLGFGSKDQRDSGIALEFDGAVPLRGIKNHVGLVLEGRYGEIAVEQGWHFYVHGYVPSLGMRWSFKDAWKE